VETLWDEVLQRRARDALVGGFLAGGALLDQHGLGQPVEHARVAGHLGEHKTKGEGEEWVVERSWKDKRGHGWIEVWRQGIGQPVEHAGVAGLLREYTRG
jgi:hypothetical protein